MTDEQLSPCILVVDDSFVVREMLESVLTEPPLNAKVVLAEHGEEALARLDDEDFDCVVCDLEMPVLDGLGFLKALRSDRSRTDLPVLLLTARDALDDKVRGFDHGASDFLTKPWEGAELIARVRTHAELARLHRRLLARTRELEQTIADLRATGVSLARARQNALDKELEVARRVQKAMVPSRDTVEVPGARLSGAVLPASICGGDFWTYERNGDVLTIFIGDVTGHGLGSAIITSVARSCIDTMSLHNPELGLSPLMHTLDEVIRRASGGEFMMTGFAAAVHPQEHKLRYCAAGHNRQYLVRAGDKPEVVSLRAKGAMLGGGDAANLEVKEVEYAAGDTLVLYTDGLIEATSPTGTMLGEKRLRAIIARDRAMEPAALVKAIQQEVWDHLGHKTLEDDVTIVVARLLE